ncbi:hypothetical protein J2X83_005214 [Brevibacillus nitrificans]|nr:hypothetical protein [Brevibacillus nitrificans]
MSRWKRLVGGINWSRWCIGLQVHDLRQSHGWVIAELNLLPLQILMRFGDGTKRLKCISCGKKLDRVSADESNVAKCLDCYYGPKET